MLLMLLEVETAAVGDALQFAEAGGGEGEAVLDVAGALRVMRELVLGVLAQDEVVAREAEGLPPVDAEVAPEGVPRLRLRWMAEELELGLVELARAEGEVSRRDLVAEGGACVADAEGHLDARRVHDVLELDEDALSGFGAEVGLVVLGRGGADVGLEHQVELAGLGE